MSASKSPELARTISLFGAVTLAVGIVVGAGMLALPGIVYQRAGGWALGSWCLDAALVAPLLVIFASLGRRYPSAGGVAGFVAAAFPGAAIGTSYVLLGTFALGIPAIASTGAIYIVQGLGVDPSAGRTAAVAALLLATGVGTTWIGARAAGALQNVVVALLIACLAGAIVGSLPSWGDIDFTVGAPTPDGLWNGAALAFFAFTGWEMLAFVSEEFKNPRRDFPRAVLLSFVVVTALYLGSSAAVQALVPFDSPRLQGAPFLAVVESITGGKVPGSAVAALVTAIIVVNLNGACWAASRLLFDIGRRGWAPGGLGLDTLSGAGATPRVAVAWLTAIFGVVLLAHAWDWVTLETLLGTAGQNFFLLYVASVAAFLALARTRAGRLFGLVALLACLIFARAYGWALLYPVLLFVAPYAVRTVFRIHKPWGRTVS
ncbi:MAG: amino acid permease [Azospirillaceae bacterium]|nr:amino acid permease [Azospirillaceae bacterium]